MDTLPVCNGKGGFLRGKEWWSNDLKYKHDLVKSKDSKKHQPYWGGWQGEKPVGLKSFLSWVKGKITLILAKTCEIMKLKALVESLQWQAKESELHGFPLRCPRSQAGNLKELPLERGLLQLGKSRLAAVGGCHGEMQMQHCPGEGENLGFTRGQQTHIQKGECEWSSLGSLRVKWTPAAGGWVTKPSPAFVSLPLLSWWGGGWGAQIWENILNIMATGSGKAWTYDR